MSTTTNEFRNDELLLDGIRNFDQSAADELYRKHKDYCIRFMATMYDERDSLMDIYHDAVIVLIENTRKKALRLVNTSIQTYLNSICRNQILVRFKGNKKVR